MLSIELEYKRGMLFIRLGGVLNKDTIYQLDEVLKDVISRVGIKYLLLNFEKVIKLEIYEVEKLLKKYPDVTLLVCGFSDIDNYKISSNLFLKQACKINTENSAFNYINI